MERTIHDKVKLSTTQDKTSRDGKRRKSRSKKGSESEIYLNKEEFLLNHSALKVRRKVCKTQLSQTSVSHKQILTTTILLWCERWRAVWAFETHFAESLLPQVDDEIKLSLEMLRRQGRKRWSFPTHKSRLVITSVHKSNEMSLDRCEQFTAGVHKATEQRSPAILLNKHDKSLCGCAIY